MDAIKNAIEQLQVKKVELRNEVQRIDDAIEALTTVDVVGTVRRRVNGSHYNWGDHGTMKGAVLGFIRSRDAGGAYRKEVVDYVIGLNNNCQKKSIWAVMSTLKQHGVIENTDDGKVRIVRNATAAPVNGIYQA